MHNIILLIIACLAFIAPPDVLARTAAMQQRCDSCHTMHNSQNATDDLTGIGPLEALLTSTCYGCHGNAGFIADQGPGVTPYVWQTSPNAVYSGGSKNTLAGGDFYWVSPAGGGIDSKGHNVEGIGSQGPRTAPGGTEFFDASRPLRCAGADGCHGDRSKSNEIVAMSRGHHGDDGTTIDGNTVATSYRFLLGVVGYEDPDWEFTSSNADHNQYKGFLRANDSPVALVPPVSSQPTISNFCSGCHGDFHNNGSGAGAGVVDGPMTNPWIRHPVDYGMGSLGGEYAGYGGVSNDYVVDTPLASEDVTASVPKSTNLTADADTIVMCLSCHRAHGSPNDAILRWDYQSWPGGGYNGCGDCHTEKI